MTNKQLKHIIKLCGDRIGAGYSYKQTYTIDEKEHVHFKVYFKELRIPKDLIIENANILSGFSNLDDLKKDYEFIIEEVNTDDGFIQIYPEDQQFKIVKSYKEASEVKSESLVALNTTLMPLHEVAESGAFVLQEEKSKAKKALIAVLLSAGIVLAKDIKDVQTTRKELYGLVDDTEYTLKAIVGPNEEYKVPTIAGYAPIANSLLEDGNKDQEGVVFMYDSPQVQTCVNLVVPDEVKEIGVISPTGSPTFTVDQITTAAEPKDPDVIELIKSKAAPIVKKLQDIFNRSTDNYNKKIDELIAGFKDYAKKATKASEEQKARVATWKTDPQGWVVGAVCNGIMCSAGIQEIESKHLPKKMLSNLKDYLAFFKENKGQDALEGIAHAAFDTVLGGLMNGVTSNNADNGNDGGTSREFHLKAVTTSDKSHEKKKKLIEKPNSQAIAMYVFSPDAKAKVDAITNELQPSDELKAYFVSIGAACPSVDKDKDDENKKTDGNKKDGKTNEGDTEAKTDATANANTTPSSTDEGAGDK